MTQLFDDFAEAYDGWFLKNRNVLESEVRLIRRALGQPGKALSVGCGSGLFEWLLRQEHGVAVDYGVEPSDPMAEVARKRGLTVRIGVAERVPYDEPFETVLFNGTPSYIADLERAFREAWRLLRVGGHIVVADVPAESSYGLLYRFAATRGSWSHPDLKDLAPEHPYPVELAAGALWRTTAEKADLLRAVGFVDLEYAQTLTCHPRFSNDRVEDPVDGCDRGDYVTIRARRP